ncbi:terminase small subunit [Spirosoma sp. KNUC1025]|uniref:terminase small subunit n=1 Tax=Spirosoma sp. KNUC1025 TaxID=2894082 RepID=UPI00386FC0A0|nr:terminase small subunit [Spirosoma sp. KNUC1025]
MESTPLDPLEGLTALEQQFVIHFCQCRSAAKAARQAGYSTKSAKEIGYQTISKPHIAAAISLLMEHYGMSAGECIGRMSAWARGSMESFLDENGRLSLTSEEAVDNWHLIKKIRQRKIVRRMPDDTVEEETQTEIELHDAKDAVDKMLQIHGRYKQVPGDAGQPKQLQSYTLPDGTVIVF